MGFIFQQLSGPQKRLELADYDAPFGRPRKDPVVRDGVELRRSINYYPGNDVEPTVHIFGDKYLPWELNGRFRDRSPTGGLGHALAKKAEVKQFTRDKQRVRITWDDVLSVVGLITKFDPGTEGKGEIEWKMTIDVYSDDLADKTPKAPPTPELADYLSQILAWMTQLPEPRAIKLHGSLFGALDQMVSTVTGAVGKLTDVANDVSNFKKSTIGELNRLSSVVTSVSTAAATFRDAFTSIGPDAALVFQRADDNAKLLTTQTSVEEQIRNTMSICAQLQRAIAIARAGTHRTTYTVKTGDTWESIAVQMYNAPGRAVDLQVVNNQIGGQPRRGSTIRIPA